MNDRNSELDALQESAAASIKTLLQQCQQQTKNTKKSVYDDDDYDDTELPTGCGIGCFDFCLGLIVDESTKIILRNAAFRVCRGLVEERNDCQIVFANKIKIIVDAIGDADKHLRKFPKIGSPPHVVLFQREALIFINDIAQRFPSIRPTLMIAARYLEEQKHISIGNESAESLLKRKSNSGLAELRRIRDLALLNTDKEVEKVRKLLIKVDACFEVLVPRFGHESGQTKTKLLLEDKLHSTNNDIDVNQELVLDYDEVSDDDDDEEDIDWEDGDNSSQGGGGEGDQTMSQIQLNEDDPEEHKMRVERTLAVMKQSGALQNDGTIGISMDREQNGIHQQTCMADEDLQRHRELLGKCIQKLSKRRDRISLWIDAILAADNMTDVKRVRKSQRSNRNMAVSTMILPESARKKIPLALRSLTNCKNSISIAVTAAKQMGVEDVGPHTSETTMPFDTVSNSIDESENRSHSAWSESHTSRNQSVHLSRSSRQPKRKRRFDIRLSKKSTSD